MAGYNDAIDRSLNLRPADLQATAADAADAANQTASGTFVVKKEGYDVIVNKVYPFSFSYLYEDPDNPSEPIVGPRSANFLFTLQTPDLTKPVTNLVVAPGLLSYGVKWDLIDKALPANKWLIDIQIYESLTGAFAGEEYLVWNGNGNSATILVSNTANRWIRVDTRDQDYRKKSVTYGPFKATDPIVVDISGPDNVTSVNTADKGIDTSGYLGFNAYANISWPAVTGGGIRGYRIRFSNDNGATYSYVDSPGTGTTYKLAGLAIGSTYKIAVATYDEYNNTSSQYVAGADVKVDGTPSVSNFIKGGPFEFGVGVGSVSTNKGLYFDASNYWYINATNSARLKVGGETSNYLLWDGTKFTIDGDISARGGTFSGNVFMSNPSNGKGASIYSGTIDAATGNLTGNGFALNSTGLKVANGTKSVTISAADGTITANGGSIGSWNITDTTLSKNNIILDSAGTIQIGSTAAQSVYLKSSGDYVMWAGNNTPDANAKFRVHKDGTLYATAASISGNITANSIAFGATYDGTSLSTIKSGAATGSTALQPNGTLTGNVSGTVGGVAVATVTAGAGRGNSAVQPGNGVTVDATTKAINKIEASSGLPLTTSGTRPVILDNLGLRMTNATGTAYTMFLDASTGSAVFRGDITGASGTFSGRLASNVTDPATSSYFDSQGSLGGVSQGLVIGAIGFKNTDVGGWTSHCYPYMPGSPNIDLGTTRFRWNDVRISGSVMVGHGGSDTVGLASGPKIKLNPGGTIYANTLGTGSGNTIVQDGGYFKVQTSSLRYKENINTMGNSGFLDIVNSLRPVTYSYIGDTGNNGSPRILSGLIAEELHQIPELRTVVNYNEENEPDGIAYDRLTASLILAIQDLSNKVDSISSRLDALEG